MTATTPYVDEAIRALTAKGYPTKNHQCQKWVRMVDQHVIGHGYDGVLQKETAKLAAFSLLKAGLAFRYSPGMILQPGDSLYKTEGSGDAGHVGKFLGKINGMPSVGENSTVHWNATGGRDARGIRSLKAFGKFQIVARFPLPKEDVPIVHLPTQPVSSTRQVKIVTAKMRKCKVTLNGAAIGEAVVIDGKAYFDADTVRNIKGEVIRVAYDKQWDIVGITTRVVT